MESLSTQRLGFECDLNEISEKICTDFNLGIFRESKLVTIGYEDFNFSLTTTKSKFFVKIFAQSRTLNDCKRNVKIMKKMFEAGVSTPKLYSSERGYLYLLHTDQATLRLCVMDFIDGRDLFTSGCLITKMDKRFLAQQAALINSADIKPKRVYDSWAITNFLQEFKKKNGSLDQDDLKLIKPLLERFKELNIETLPHCFIHGDIIKTNVLKDKEEKIWIIDFSVSNYYPRIQEIAVLCCDVLFNRYNQKESEENLQKLLEEYQKKIKLTPLEIFALPTYIKLAHAMHVLCASYEQKVNHNLSKENEYFLTIGRLGLRQ